MHHKVLNPAAIGDRMCCKIVKFPLTLPCQV